MSVEDERSDPQWIPSDAEMINWIERGYTVRPATTGLGWNGWTVRGMNLIGKPVGEGLTWRAAVEDAMRNEIALMKRLDP